MAEEISLLDMPGRYHVHWYVIYMPEESDAWWNRFLVKGFRHVQLWRPIQFGPSMNDRFWLVVDPGMEHIDTKIDHCPIAPWDRVEGLTVQSVQTAVTAKRIRERCFIGPITCVEIAKAHLGIKGWRIRTPLQLYKHIHKNNHCIVLR